MLTAAFTGGASSNDGAAAGTSGSPPSTTPFFRAFSRLQLRHHRSESSASIPTYTAL